MGLSVDEIKKFNAEAQQMKAEASKLSMELKYREENINNLLMQLSKEIGTEVTIENAEQVCADLENKLTEQLRAGREVMARIKAEGEQASALEAAKMGYEATGQSTGAVVNGAVQMMAQPQTMVQPTSQSVVQPMAQPQPMVQPMVQQMVQPQPMAQPVAQPIAQTAVNNNGMNLQNDFPMPQPMPMAQPVVQSTDTFANNDGVFASLSGTNVI